LLLLFVPGAYITLIVLTLLVALQGALVLATLFALSFVVGGILTFVVLGVGLATFLGLLGLVQATASSLKPAESGAYGVEGTPEQAPRLWAEVRGLAERLRAKPPDNVVVGIQPGFWVTEAKVHCVTGRLAGRTMYLSLSESRVLAKDELVAILGHELAHYKG